MSLIFAAAIALGAINSPLGVDLRPGLTFIQAVFLGGDHRSLGEGPVVNGPHRLASLTSDNEERFNIPGESISEHVHARKRKVDYGSEIFIYLIERHFILEKLNGVNSFIANGNVRPRRPPVQRLHGPFSGQFHFDIGHNASGRGLSGIYNVNAYRQETGKLHILDFADPKGDVGADLLLTDLSRDFDLGSGGVGIFGRDLKRLSLVRFGLARLPAGAPLKQQIQSIPAPGFAERAVRLPNRDDKAEYGSQTENGSDDRRYRCKMGFIRCFFRSDGGAPLGAQVGGIVILSAIAGVGIALGVGPVGRFRRWGWRGSRLGRCGWLICAFASLGLFGWPLSAA